MRVGLTYDLRDEYLALGFGEEETAEFDSPATIDAIEAALRRRGLDTVRIGNVRTLVNRLAGGERWDLVFNIAEGLKGVSREAQVPALLEAFDIPYTFSDPLTMTLTLDKAMAKRVARDHGIPTAPFLVIEHPHQSLPRDSEFPLFVKPLAEGTGKGVTSASLVRSPAEFSLAVRSLLKDHRQAVLVEHYLPGREFTVGVVGSGASAQALGVMEIVFGDKCESGGYTYENKEHYEDRVRYRLVDDAEARMARRSAISAWRALRCRDGGRVDLRSDANGVPNFLEVNPLAGLHPVRSDLVILARLAGIDYDQLINRIVDAALWRCRRSLPQPEAPEISA